MRENKASIKLAIIIGILCAVVLFVAQMWHDNAPFLQKSDVSGMSTLSTQMRELNTATELIRVADRDVMVTIADTPTMQQRGLGGRAGLGPDEGMLFVFSKDAPYSFWMKDMRFSIDIIWLSSTGTVITIASNVSPDTYPQSFAPTAPARYVLELPAGFARTYNLRVGDTVQL